MEAKQAHGDTTKADIVSSSDSSGRCTTASHGPFHGLRILILPGGVGLPFIRAMLLAKAVIAGGGATSELPPETRLGKRKLRGKRQKTDPVAPTVIADVVVRSKIYEHPALKSIVVEAPVGQSTIGNGMPVFVSPEWVSECARLKRRVSLKPYLIGPLSSSGDVKDNSALVAPKSSGSCRSEQLSRKRCRSSESPSTPSELPSYFGNVRIGTYVVDAFGLGTLPLSVRYPNPSSAPSRKEAKELLIKAFNDGIQFVDTADTYGPGPKDKHYAEQLISEALGEWNQNNNSHKDVRFRSVVVATKGGMRRISPTSSGWREGNMSPAGIENCIRGSYRALNSHFNFGPISIWMLHHPPSKDPEGIRLAAAMQRAGKMQKLGLVKHLGICNASVRQVKLATRAAGCQLVCVEAGFSIYDMNAAKKIRSRESISSKRGLLDYCKQMGMAFIPYGALGGLKTRDGRRCLKSDHPELTKLALRLGVESPHVLLLAWMSRRWPGLMLHIVGMRRIERLKGVVNARKMAKTLSESAIQKLDELLLP